MTSETGGAGGTGGWMTGGAGATSVTGECRFRPQRPHARPACLASPASHPSPQCTAIKPPRDSRTRPQSPVHRCFCRSLAFHFSLGFSFLASIPNSRRKNISSRSFTRFWMSSAEFRMKILRSQNLILLSTNLWLRSAILFLSHRHANFAPFLKWRLRNCD